jgi:hypothetical protein
MIRTRQFRRTPSAPLIFDARDAGRISPRSTVLVAVDSDRVWRVLKLPRLGAHAPAHLGRKQVQRLLEAVPGMRPGEQQELRHPTHELRLVLIQRQIRVLQELGVTIEHLAQLAIVFRHIQLPFYPDLCNA